jgi:hypothetical protein
MRGSIMIHGSGGEVLSALGNGSTFYQGRHQVIMVDSVGPDEETPLIVREVLVGMEVPIIFTAERLKEQGVTFPEGCVFSYAASVIETLVAAGKLEAADALKAQAPNEFDMYGFEAGIFHILPPPS